MSALNATKAFIQDHLDEVVSLLNVIDAATGGTGLIHEADVALKVVAAAIDALKNPPAQPRTQADVDALAADLHEQLAANLAEGEKRLHERFDKGGA